MKTIIDGKLYDTENAEMFCEYSFSHTGDFQHVYEALYKSPNGQFFIRYSGGPMSKYAVSSGANETSGSSGIRLVTEDEAKAFIEKNGTSDDYVEAFGQPELGQKFVVEDRERDDSR